MRACLCVCVSVRARARVCDIVCTQPFTLKKEYQTHNVIGSCHATLRINRMLLVRPPPPATPTSPTPTPTPNPTSPTPTSQPLTLPHLPLPAPHQAQPLLLPPPWRRSRLRHGSQYLTAWCPHSGLDYSLIDGEDQHPMARAVWGIYISRLQWLAAMVWRRAPCTNESRSARAHYSS